jgi:ubiquinol-cytochrome c reductase cytochrome b subunit
MFWPDQLLKDTVAMLAVMAVVLGVILVPAIRAMLAGDTIHPGHLGAELGAPADPSQPYAAARPEWYFLFLFQFLKVFEGWGATGEFVGAILVPGLIMTVMALMPIIGNWRLGHRFNVAFTVAVLAGAGLLTALALNEDYAALWVNRASLADAEDRTMASMAAVLIREALAARGVYEKKTPPVKPPPSPPSFGAPLSAAPLSLLSARRL